MSFPSQSEYFTQRATESRSKRDEASDPSIAYAHGELADRYQSAADKAKGVEMGEAAHHDDLERQQRDLSDTAVNEATRDFHHEAANRHSSRARAIREDAFGFESAKGGRH